MITVTVYSPEFNRARVKAWRLANLARRKTYEAEWVDLNRDYINKRVRERRAARKPQCQVAGCRKPVGYRKQMFCDADSAFFSHKSKGSRRRR